MITASANFTPILVWLTGSGPDSRIPTISSPETTCVSTPCSIALLTTRSAAFTCTRAPPNKAPMPSMWMNTNRSVTISIAGPLRLPGAARPPYPGSDQPAVAGPAGQLVPRRQLQLAEHAGHVRLDRLDRDEQLLGDLLVRVAAGDQPHHLAFALGEPVEVLVDVGHVDRAGERVQHEPRQPRREHRVAVGDPPDGLHQLRAGDR